MQNSLERLLNQAEQDTVQAFDEAMRLMVEFGDDSLLMGFVGSANQLKLDRNTDVQFLILQVSDLSVRASRLKETVLEISRND